MKLLRHTLALLLLAVLPLGLGGCLFDHPLTEVSSTNLDTRLLGVFEFKEGTKNKKDAAAAAKKPGDTTAAAADDDTAAIQRVAVLPLSDSRYVIYYRDFSKKPAQTMKFIGWISRVDSHYYLTFRDETEGSSTFGKYGFFKFEWEFPGNFQLYAPDMKGLEHASSYQMRAGVRKRLKAGVLFPYEATYWRKIARVWTTPKDFYLNISEPGALPPEFENGTKADNPGL
jgi:hypothetical protein